MLSQCSWADIKKHQGQLEIMHGRTSTISKYFPFITHVQLKLKLQKWQGGLKSNKLEI